MKDIKSFLLVIVGLLCLLSLLILGSWGYYLYKKYNDQQSTIAALNKSSIASTKDSLAQLYQSTIKRFDDKVSGIQQTDTTNLTLQKNVAEFNALKQEIEAILQAKATTLDVEIARQKINLLQLKVEALYNKNVQIEAENKRLSDLLARLQTQTTSNSVEQVAPLSSTRTENAPATLTATELNLQAYRISEDREIETNSIESANKLSGSFVLRGPAPAPGSEMMVVLIQPNGRVLQKSTWESGFFTTTSGKKIYSCKVKLDDNRTDDRSYSFFINTENALKGTYTVQLYLNGQLLNKMQKTFS
ncbi:MAG: hypothetical protein ACOYKE_12385 [Ferruginibacter sp.]